MKIALVGNCQVRSYQQILQDSLSLGSFELALLDFSTAESRDEAVRQSFAASIEDYDFVFVQSNGLSYTRPSDLRAQVKRSSAVVQICNFYFRGLHPDLCYVGSFGKRAGWTDYNSLVCLNGYKNGLEIDVALDQLLQGQVREPKIMNAWNDSIEELRLRDRDLDFPGSDLVDSSCRQYQAFYTMNHPSLFLLQDYIYSIMSALGFSYSRNIYKTSDDPLSFLRYPIYDFWALHNRLPYRTTQHIYIHGQFFPLKQFFINSYRSYGNADSEILVVSSPSKLA